MYDEAGRWLGDYDNAGVPKQQVIWLDDLPVGLVDAAGLKYIEPDPLGMPRVVIDPVPNAAVWRWDLQGAAFAARPTRARTGRAAMRRICGSRGRV